MFCAEDCSPDGDCGFRRCCSWLLLRYSPDEDCGFQRYCSGGTQSPGVPLTRYRRVVLLMLCGD